VSCFNLSVLTCQTHKAIANIPLRQLLVTVQHSIQCGPHTVSLGRYCCKGHTIWFAFVAVVLAYWNFDARRKQNSD
jgi:hypothetical protein